MPIHLPRADDAKRQRDKIRELIHHLDDDTIDRLLNRARYPAVDAYAGGESGGGNSVSRPTEAAAVRDAGGRITQDAHGAEVCTKDNWEQPADPVRDAIGDLFAELAEAHGLVRRLDKHRQYLATDHERATARRSSIAGDCLCCGVTCSGAQDDKLISGYCRPCYDAWRYAGSDDRVRFQRDHALRYPHTHVASAAIDPAGWDPARHLGAHQFKTARTPTGGS